MFRKAKELSKLEKLLLHINRAEGQMISIPLNGGAFYISLIDTKVHQLTVDTPPEIVLDVWCNNIMVGEERIPITVEMIINLTDN